MIASYVNKDTGEAWPSRATLRAITGIEERDISRTVRELKEAGFFTVEEREGHSNIYRLTLGDSATGGNLPPLGILPPTPGDLAAKPLGILPPITMKEQSSNNETTGDAKKVKTKKPRLKANEHPTWLLWLQVNQNAGQPPPP